jgi:hypothetical protein
VASNQQSCPVCRRPIAFFPRYPRYLCVECAARATSKDGRLLKFSNIDLSGGFVAHYADTGEHYPSHECYVDGILCSADEHRFGGIVIQTVEGSA